jgi:hypothetical protein
VTRHDRRRDCLFARQRAEAGGAYQGILIRDTLAPGMLAALLSGDPRANLYLKLIGTFGTHRHDRACVLCPAELRSAGDVAAFFHASAAVDVPSRYLVAAICRSCADAPDRELCSAIGKSLRWR